MILQRCGVGASLASVFTFGLGGLSSYEQQEDRTDDSSNQHAGKHDFATPVLPRHQKSGASRYHERQGRRREKYLDGK